MRAMPARSLRRRGEIERSADEPATGDGVSRRWPRRPRSRPARRGRPAGRRRRTAWWRSRSCGPSARGAAPTTTCPSPITGSASIRAVIRPSTISRLGRSPAQPPGQSSAAQVTGRRRARPSSTYSWQSSPMLGCGVQVAATRVAARRARRPARGRSAARRPPRGPSRTRSSPGTGGCEPAYAAIGRARRRRRRPPPPRSELRSTTARPATTVEPSAARRCRRRPSTAIGVSSGGGGAG